MGESLLPEDKGRRLKGSLVKKPNRLTGKMLDRDESSREPEVNVRPEIAIGTKIIQRDSGDEFEVANIQASTTSEKFLVKLKSLKDGHTVNKHLDDLAEMLATEGTAWHW